MGRVFYEIGSQEAAWSSRYKYDDDNTGHRPGVKGGYFPVSPVDSLGDLRAELPKHAQERVTHELAKDLVHLDGQGLAQHLTDADIVL